MDFVVVKDIGQGIERTKEFLYEEVDRKTVLFLSGGKTPQALYEALAKEQIITPAAVAQIDERYGQPFHADSNELMMQKTGLLHYVEQKNIPFYPMLGQLSAGARSIHPRGGNQQLKQLEQAALDYEQTVRDLFFKFPKSIAIMGIGADGHIASIFPNRNDYTDPLFTETPTYQYVAGVEDPGKYGKRITLTFAGLSLIDFFLVFVFGKDKKKALTKTLSQGSIEEIPARFFQQPDISEKTLFITDQKI